jgi:predicted Zn finger-like uncharacterized protein
MRFECDSCNAKYKISEDKVRGRVVRFPCRKCDHKILIDGRRQEADVTVPAAEAYNFQDVTRRSEPVSRFSADEVATARARRPSSPPRRRSPSVPPRRPSAASRRVSSVPAAASTAVSASGSAFLGQEQGLTPPVPRAVVSPFGVSKEAPEWHVSVNDVPIGPIRLEEMGHKIDAGAVSEYSLVWRDGFEEWRPLATVPELMSLLHTRRHSGPPPRSTFSSMPPFAETRVSLSDSSPVAAIPGSMHAAASSDDEILPLADALQPDDDFESGLNARSQPAALLAVDGSFDSSPQLGSYSGLPPSPDDEVSIPSVPPEPASVDTAPDPRISIGVWALMLAILVFAGVAGFLAFERFGDRIMNELLGSNGVRAVAKPSARPTLAPPTEAPIAEQPAVDSPTATPGTETEVTEPDAADTGEGALGVEDEQGVAAEEPSEDASNGGAAATLVPPPDPKDNQPKIAPAARPRPKVRRKPRARPVAPAATAETPTDEVSTAEQKILEEFDSSIEAAPAKIAVREPNGTQSSKPALDGDAVRETVAANKPRLQRCYERAIRGQTSAAAVRLDVTVTVAPSGRVKDVTSTGEGPGGLAECIEASVRRWRFPESSDGGPARFPLVFSAN